jgi:hypothetical protein
VLLLLLLVRLVVLLLLMLLLLRVMHRRAATADAPPAAAHERTQARPLPAQRAQRDEPLLHLVMRPLSRQIQSCVPRGAL